MSTRSFFDIRLLLPGFSFAIFFLLFNPELIYFIIVTQLGVNIVNILASVIIMPALGFLISQPWFFVYHHIIKPTKLWKGREEAFIKKFELKKFDKNIQSQEMIIYDYFMYYQASKENKNDIIASYLDRRWDLFSTMGSTISAIVISGILSYVSRYFIKLEILYKMDLTNKMSFNNYFIVVIISFFLTIILLACGMSWIRDEINKMCIALIQGSKMRRNELISAFPDLENDSSKPN